MKKLKLILILLFTTGSILATSCNQKASGEHAEDDTMAASSEDMEEDDGEEAPSQASPRKQASGEVNGVSIAVDYGSPSVKGREIWGGLESYGKVWRAGANECTNIEFKGDVTINGESLAAGKYGLFMVPNEDGDWVVIFNKVWDQWGAFSYDDGQDALRVEVTPEWSDDVQEALTYEVTDGGLGFAWEKARINLTIDAQ